MKRRGLPVALILAVTLSTVVAASQERGPAPFQCGAAENCRIVKFAFINFTGERLTLTLDETLVLDDRLQTEDWSTALSRYMELPIRPSTTMVMTLDGAIIYEGLAAGPEVQTIYVDARHDSPVRQTSHPAPLLD